MSGNKRKGRESLPPVAKKQSKKELVANSVVSVQSSDDKSSSESKSELGGNADEHPLQVGHYLVVKYRDGSNRLAKIVESSAGSSPRSTQYYIHYPDFNRRMDEWIGAPRIVAYPSEANILGANREAQENAAKKLKTSDSKGSLTDLQPAVEINPKLQSLLGNPTPTRSGPVGRTTKSRSNSVASVAQAPVMAISTVADMEHDEHEGMDEESLLEHEEVTKVRVNCITFLIFTFKISRALFPELTNCYVLPCCR